MYVSMDGGKSWIKMKNNMPTNRSTTSRSIPGKTTSSWPPTDAGIYIADISPLAEVNLETLGTSAFFFQPESKVRWVAGVSHETASDNFNGESEAAEIPFYYWLQRDVAGQVSFEVKQGNVTIATVEGPGGAGLHKVVWGMIKTPEGQPQQPPEGAARFQGRARAQPAPLGEYTVVMSVNGQEISRTVSILKDEWWMNRR